MCLAKVDTEIQNLSVEQPRYPHWLGQVGECDCLGANTEETEGDPIRYALATRREQQLSALALERVFPVCRPIGSSTIIHRALGWACIESTSPCRRGPGGRS